MGERPLAIGLDVGGSKVSGVLMSDEGSVLASELLASPADDVEAMVETVVLAAERLRAKGPAAAVGLGAAGMVEHTTGVLRSAPNIAWTEVPLRDLVRRRIGLPCVVDNDANAAAWGEFRFGAGRGLRHVLLVTVGTGIGGGLIQNGRLYRGAHGFAAEIGHIIVEPDGPPCGCGNRGCWEQMASGQALERMAREAALGDPAGPIARTAGGRPPVGPDVVAAAAAGDPAAGTILETVGRRLGEGLAGLANVLDPEAIVVGGGMAEIGAPFLDPARVRFLEAVEAPDHRPEIPILQAVLGNDAGAIGAAAMALEPLEDG
ncbi:MAG TPA: ROK family protein [Actinomycetota bacterium]